MEASSLTKLNFARRRSLSLVRQSEATECGLACLAMVVNFYGYGTDIAALRRRFKIGTTGSRLSTIAQMADACGFRARGLQVPLEDCNNIRTPAILHWNMNHFVVLAKSTGNRFVVYDPAIGIRVYPREEFSQHFTGIALELEPTAAFQARNDKQPMRLRDLWSDIQGLKSAAVKALGLSATMQFFVLLSPFYLQIVVDQALATGDTFLLSSLGIGFGLFVAIQAIAELLRGYTLLYLSSSLNFQIVSNLFSHLLRLPLSFFEKRQIGDVISRFSSTAPIEEMLTEGLIETAIDGVLAATTLTLMFVYSPLLGALSLGVLVFYLSMRLLSFRRFRQHNEEIVVARAEEGTSFIENVRGIMTVKLFGKETNRTEIWQNRKANVINAEITVGKFKTWYMFANTFLFGVENILIIYIAANMVLDHSFSIGMIFAFMTYKLQFTDKASRLVERYIDFRMLDLHLARIGDIAQTRQDQRHKPQALTKVVNLKRLQLKDISFSYDDGPPVLLNLSFDFPIGKSTAIVGQSGCGKTTLVKVLLGLFRPTSGAVLVDGRDLREIELQSYLSQVAAVMQEDTLFTGTLAENIAFDAAEIDLERVQEAAKMACVHPDILQMPMQYETFVGDMGSALSGGQKQRILLARALYKRPKLLFMDEGTAHLDVETEKMVSQSISSLGITRILVAHRPETIKSADLVWRIGKGHPQTVY